MIRRSRQFLVASSSFAPSSSSSSSSIPYDKHNLSTERFFWKSSARRLLKELSENNMKPNLVIPQWTIIERTPQNDKDDPLVLKQYNIESKYYREVVDHPANHSFQKEAFHASEEFLKRINNKNKTFEDILRFRAQHGVALPVELAYGVQLGWITAADLSHHHGDHEAVELAQKLAPDLKYVRRFIVNDVWNRSSALLRASGIGLTAPEFGEVADEIAAGHEANHDKTSNKILVETEGACRANNINKHQRSTGSFFFPKRMQKVKDWSKAHIVFIDLPALNRTLQQTTGFYPSYSKPTDEPLLDIKNLFPSPLSSDDNNMDTDEAEDLMKGHIMKLCVPKISTFSLVSSTCFSKTALNILKKKIRQDPNLIVVYQHMPYVDDLFYSGNRVFQPPTSDAGVVPDMTSIIQVSLQGLPIHGYTTSIGAQGMISWIEDVLKDELGFPLDTIRVSAINTALTDEAWCADIADKNTSIYNNDQRLFLLEDTRVPACLFDTYWEQKPIGSLSMIPLLISEWVSGLWSTLTFKSSSSTSKPSPYSNKDCSPACQVMIQIDGDENEHKNHAFWRGVPMPTTRRQLIDAMVTSNNKKSEQFGTNEKYWKTLTSTVAEWSEMKSRRRRVKANLLPWFNSSTTSKVCWIVILFAVLDLIYYDERDEKAEKDEKDKKDKKAEKDEKVEKS